MDQSIHRQRRQQLERLKNQPQTAQVCRDIQILRQQIRQTCKYKGVIMPTRSQGRLTGRRLIYAKLSVTFALALMLATDIFAVKYAMTVDYSWLTACIMSGIATAVALRLFLHLTAPFRQKS